MNLIPKRHFSFSAGLAKKIRSLIREIVSRGHEIASRGFYHRSVRHLTPEEFRADLQKTNRVLEDASGQKIIGYRSAEKLNYEKDDWIFDILAEEDFVYDASFLPTQKAEKQKRFAHQVHTGGKAIWEFPYSTVNLGVGLLPISGGNYFRQIPYTLMRRAVHDWTAKYEEPFVMYFHVWELDAGTAAHQCRFALQPHPSLSQSSIKWNGSSGKICKNTISATRLNFSG